MALNIDIKENNYLVYYRYYEYDLYSYMVQLKKPMNEEIIKYILYCILQGLKKMHENWFLHRDIKSSNVLIGESGVVISDFGMACQFSIP